MRNAAALKAPLQFFAPALSKVDPFVTHARGTLATGRGEIRELLLEEELELFLEEVHPSILLDGRGIGGGDDAAGPFRILLQSTKGHRFSYSEVRARR